MSIKPISRLALACVVLSSISMLAQASATQDNNNLKVTIPDLKTKLELDAAVL